jgi:hypothetical protein
VLYAVHALFLRATITRVAFRQQVCRTMPLLMQAKQAAEAFPHILPAARHCRVLSKI